MAREGLRSHLSGSVPISIGLHLVALLLFLIIPLVADVSLPRVWVDLPDYVRVAPMPPPPAVTVRTPPPQATPGPAANPAPTMAPPTIEPEGPERAPALPIGISTSSTGVPSGVGLETGAGSSVLMPVPPPAPPRQAGPVRVAQLPIAPKKIADARPLYPEIARAARREGTVVLEAVLDTTGRVTQLRVIQSVPLLDQAALDAVRQWRYTPSVYGGQPVSVLMTITIRFTLQ
jgi:protein TonB